MLLSSIADLPGYEVDRVEGGSGLERTPGRAGAAALLGVLAVIIAGGGAALASVVEFDSVSGRVFRLAIGLVLIALGLRQAHLFGVRMRWIDRVAGSASRIFDSSSVSGRARGDVAYGFGYLLAGFG